MQKVKEVKLTKAGKVPKKRELSIEFDYLIRKNVLWEKVNKLWNRNKMFKEDMHHIKTVSKDQTSQNPIQNF